MITVAAAVPRALRLCLIHVYIYIYTHILNPTYIYIYIGYVLGYVIGYVLCYVLCACAFLGVSSTNVCRERAKALARQMKKLISVHRCVLPLLYASSPLCLSLNPALPRHHHVTTPFAVNIPRHYPHTAQSHVQVALAQCGPARTRAYFHLSICLHCPAPYDGRVNPKP